MTSNIMFIAQWWKRAIVILSFLSAMTGSLTPAQASRPVARQITGCVTQGVLISDNGYRIRVFHSGTRAPFDLRPYEGWRIRFHGFLLPGDSYFVRQPPVRLDRCRPQSSGAGPLIKVPCRDMGDGRTLIDSAYLPDWYDHNRSRYEIVAVQPAPAQGAWANRICTIRILTGK